MNPDRKNREPISGSAAGNPEVCVRTDKPLQVVRLFLDDVRIPPKGWVHVRTPGEAIEILKTGTVIEVSLDHDLGDGAHGTGYDVILWIEEAVDTQRFIPPERMRVHSANASARQKMEAGIQSIYRIYAKRNVDEPGP